MNAIPLHNNIVQTLDAGGINMLKNQKLDKFQEQDIKLKEASVQLANTFKSLLMGFLFKAHKSADCNVQKDFYQGEWLNSVMSTNKDLDDPLVRGIYEQLKVQHQGQRTISITA